MGSEGSPKRLKDTIWVNHDLRMVTLSLYEKIGLQLENQVGSLKKKKLIDLNLIEFKMQSEGHLALFLIPKLQIWPNTKYQ